MLYYIANKLEFQKPSDAPSVTVTSAGGVIPPLGPEPPPLTIQLDPVKMREVEEQQRAEGR